MVPQLDGTYNVSGDSDLDSHSYLDLASSNIIVHRTQGQKQRYETDIRAHTSKRLAQKESTKPNMNTNMKGQKVPDDENIDINKIAQGDRPKGGRNTADITAKQHKDKEAKRLVPEKVKRIQGQNDSKNTEAKRHMIEKAKIEALIEKHRLRTPKTPDKVNKMGTGKNAIEKGQEGTSKGKPPYKKATKDIQIKKSHKKGTEATNAEIGKTDTLLGDPVANTATGITNEKGKGQKDKTDIDDIGIFEFIFKGPPELPELEGIDEDRLRDLQNAAQIEPEGCDISHNALYSHQIDIAKESEDFEKSFYIYQHFQDSEMIHQIGTDSGVLTTQEDSLYPYINNDIEYGLFEDIVKSYLLDSQIKDDFPCDLDCYTQTNQLTKDDYPNICTHNYQHIAQHIDDLSDPIQQNKLYSREESVLSFTDDTDTHCDYNISDHNSDIPNIDDTYKCFMPKHPVAHS